MTYSLSTATTFSKVSQTKLLLSLHVLLQFVFVPLIMYSAEVMNIKHTLLTYVVEYDTTILLSLDIRE